MIDFDALDLVVIGSQKASSSDIETLSFQSIIGWLRGYKNSYNTNRAGFGLEQWAWDIDNPNMLGRQWEYPWAIINGFADGDVIDIGSGYRPFSFLLQEDHHVTCVDNNTDVVQACIDNGIAAVAADLTNIPLSKEYADVIYCISVIEHLKDIDQVNDALREMRRLIKPGGRIILTVDLTNMTREAFSDLIVDRKDALRETVNGNEVFGVILAPKETR